MILIVTASAKASAEVREQLQGRSDIRVTHPGDMLAGHRFDTVLVTDFYHRNLHFSTPEEVKRIQKWYRDNVATRLTVGGLILNL